MSMLSDVPWAKYSQMYIHESSVRGLLDSGGSVRDDVFSVVLHSKAVMEIAVCDGVFVTTGYEKNLLCLGLTYTS